MSPPVSRVSFDALLDPAWTVFDLNQVNSLNNVGRP